MEHSPELEKIYVEECMKYNFYIRKLDVIEHYSAYKIFFDVNDERIYSNKETRSDLEYILNKFAGVIEK